MNGLRAASVLGVLPAIAWAMDPPTSAIDDLKGYRPVAAATTARIKPAPPTARGQATYLGASLQPGPGGRLQITAVQAGSPANVAGLRPGDVIVKLDGEAVVQLDVFREAVQARSPGDKMQVALERAGKPLATVVMLAAVSRPMLPPAERPYLGIEFKPVADGDEGAVVERVAPGTPAAAAGLKPGDVVLKVDNAPLEQTAVADFLSTKRPGDTVQLTLRRAGKEVAATAQLTANRSRGRGGFRFTAGPPTTPWTKDRFRLAVVGVEFADVKHNPAITRAEWEAALFSTGRYTKKNATGQAVHGSLRDYFAAQSYGAFTVEGKVFDWVATTKKRADYSQGSGTSNQGALPSDALASLLAREGADALKDFDGICFLYAGQRVRTNRGGVYYPHSGRLPYRGKVWPFLLCYEGGNQMATLDAFVREFAYLLGLPDLAARPENAGSEGVGPWCMLGGPLAGRPQNLCAWAREQLGWLKPVVVEPTVQQKLVLAPVAEGPGQCLKVLVRLDGSEYFLLENRRKMGWDENLPGEGLLIWRVVNGRPVLEESHGIEGPAGPRSQLALVPYPSSANRAFTPDTTPSSQSTRGGGLPVHITEIRRLSDGRVAFQIGYVFD